MLQIYKYKSPQCQICTLPNPRSKTNMTTNQLHKLRFLLTILQCLQALFYATYIVSTHATPTYANQQPSYQNVCIVSTRNIVLMQHHALRPSDLAADLRGKMQPRSTTSLHTKPDSSSTSKTRQVSFLNLNLHAVFSCNRYNKPKQITYSSEAHQLEFSVEQKTANPNKKEVCRLQASCPCYDLPHKRQQKNREDTNEGSNKLNQPSPNSIKASIEPVCCNPTSSTNRNYKPSEDPHYFESAQAHTQTGYPQNEEESKNQIKQDCQPTTLHNNCAYNFCPRVIQDHTTKHSRNEQNTTTLTSYDNTSTTTSRNGTMDTHTYNNPKIQRRNYISIAASHTDTGDAYPSNDFETQESAAAAGIPHTVRGAQHKENIIDQVKRRRQAPSQPRPLYCNATTSAHEIGKKKPDTNLHQKQSGHVYSLGEEAAPSNPRIRHQQAQPSSRAPTSSGRRIATTSQNVERIPCTPTTCTCSVRNWTKLQQKQKNDNTSSPRPNIVSHKGRVKKKTPVQNSRNTTHHSDIRTLDTPIRCHRHTDLPPQPRSTLLIRKQSFRSHAQG